MARDYNLAIATIISTQIFIMTKRIFIAQQFKRDSSVCDYDYATCVVHVAHYFLQLFIRYFISFHSVSCVLFSLSLAAVDS